MGYSVIINLNNNNNMKEVKIKPKNTFTKMAYHKATGMSRATIDKYIKHQLLDTVRINGGVLIIAKEGGK